MIKGLSGVATVAVLFTALQFHREPSQATALDVRRINDVISVNLKAADARTDSIIHELNAFGVDATITEVPASPSGVGQFLNTQYDGTGKLQPTGYSRHFTIPDTNGQHITLLRGRTAQPEEAYDYRPSAYASGEPLHCSNTLGQKGQTLSKTLHERHIEASWQLLEAGSQPVSEQRAQDEYVVNALSDKPNSVVVYVSHEPRPLGSTTDCD
jgi:hypothetical protein